MATFGDTLAAWGAFNSNLKNRLADLPDLAPDQQAFEALIAEGLALAARQDKQIAAVREASQARKELVLRGSRLREFLATTLRHKLGFDNKVLREFNIRPRGDRKKKKPEGEIPEIKATQPQSPSQP